MLSYVERVTAAKSVEEVWTAHVDEMARHGFDRVLYGLTTAIDHPGFGELDDILVLSNHAADYLDPFLDKRMYLSAPMVRWSRHNTGACSWSWIGANRDKLSARESETVNFNKKMGVTAGYSISFPIIAGGKKAAIGLAAPPGVTQSEVDEIWRTAGREIEAKNMVFNLKIITLPLNLRANRLSDRQREVLEWVAGGHTVQETAEGLEVKATTVEKHLRLAREVLGVDTTAQAVLKATLHNQIYLVRG